MRLSSLVAARSVRSLLVWPMISDVAEAALAAALAGWRVTGLADPAVARVAVGDVSIADCCEGVLLLNLGQLVWWQPFPFEAIAQGGRVAIPFVGGDLPCTGTFGAAATLWIGRCVPISNDRGGPPDPVAEAEAMMTLADLVQTIGSEMACDEQERWVVGGADWVGLEGGCLYGLLALRLDAS